MNFLNSRNRRSDRTGNPKVLSGRDIPSLASYIKSEDCKNIIMMLGAGVSTSAGIPDFRSPETGLYSNLARLNLPHPEAVFEINFFRKNPVPFYTLAHELYPGKFRPTITHSFIRLLSEKSLLHTCYTQNIDTLERRAGVPDGKIIEAHGSFASQRCINCRKSFDDQKMKEHILQKKIAKCTSCGGYVKPDIVFFGEGLPPHFINSLDNLSEADLLIVIGTSLTVHPFAALAGLVKDSCPRVLINLDHVGDFGSRADDVILLGKCDDVVKDLCKELSWNEELDRLWGLTKESTLTDTKPADEEATAVPSVSTNEEKREPKSTDVLKDIEERLANLAVDDSPTPAGPTKEPIDKDVPPATPILELSGSTTVAKEDTALPASDKKDYNKEEKFAEPTEGKL